MMNYLLPTWLVATFEHWDLMIICVMTGYFVGNEGGLWKAIKRATMLTVIGSTLMALYLFVKLGMPFLSEDSIKARLGLSQSQSQSWFGQD